MEIPVIRVGTISAYKFLIMFAIVLGIIYLFTRKEYTLKQKIVVFITTIISGFVGARLFYAVVNYKTIVIQKVFSFQFMFFKGYGAFIFGLINIIVLSKIYKIKLTNTLEPLLSWFYIGGALAKIGCFFTGCCKGIVTDGTWGIYRKYDIVKVHPTELYDCGAFIISLIILLIMRKMKVKETTRMAISLMVYVILRGLIEGFYYNGIMFGDTVSRIVYGCTIFGCLCIIGRDIFLKISKRIKQN